MGTSDRGKNVVEEYIKKKKKMFFYVVLEWKNKVRMFFSYAECMVSL